MSGFDLPSWQTVLSTIGLLLFLGAMPELTVRCASLLYPTGHPRRGELIAEMAHVRGLAKMPQQWLWLGQTIAVALWEGLAERGQAVRRRRRLAQGLRRGRVLAFAWGVGLTTPAGATVLAATTLSLPWTIAAAGVATSGVLTFGSFLWVALRSRRTIHVFDVESGGC